MRFGKAQGWELVAREPTVRLEDRNFQFLLPTTPHPPSISRERRGTADGVQSPMANDLFNQVYVTKPP